MDPNLESKPDKGDALEVPAFGELRIELRPADYQSYRGKSGYLLMMKELQESIDQSFPEFLDKQSDGSLVRRIHLFDHYNDPQKEVLKAEAALGMKPGSLMKQVQSSIDVGLLPSFGQNPQLWQGTIITLEREDKTHVVIAAGHPSPENPSAFDIRNHARVNLHEVFHGLYHLKYPNEEPTREVRIGLVELNKKFRGKSFFQAFYSLDSKGKNDYLFNEMWKKSNESMAETFARSSLVHNGAPRDFFIDQAQAKFDSNIRHQADDASKAPYDPRYDPSEELEHVQKNYPKFLEGPPILKSYQLVGLKEALEITHQAGSANRPLRAREVYSDFRQEKALSQVLEYFKGKGSDALFEWLERNRDSVLIANKALAGREYLESASSEAYQPPNPGVKTLEQATGRAFLNALETKDPADIRFTSNLMYSTFYMGNIGLRDTAGITFQEVTDYINLALGDRNENDSSVDFSWAEKLANGSKIDSVIENFRLSQKQLNQ